MNKKFPYNFIPNKNATIDESMIKFKGRLSFVNTYLQSPQSVEFGTVPLATCTDSKFILVKKMDRKRAFHTECYEWTFVLICLVKTCVYFDKFYTGVELLQDLHTRGVMACGTVCTNRKRLPKELLPKQLKLNKYEYKVAQKDELTFCVWQDTKAVCVLSNFHDLQAVGVVNRRSGLNIQRPVEVPKMLADYQKNMKGVDLCDQMTDYYLLNHRSKKWWRQIFFYLMEVSAYNAYEVSAYNAYVIARDSNPNKVNATWPLFQSYVEDLVISLIGDTRAGKATVLVPEPTRATCKHTIEKMYVKNKTGHECVLAAQSGERRGVTKFGCRECNVPVHTECQGKHIMRCISGN